MNSLLPWSIAASLLISASALFAQSPLPNQTAQPLKALRYAFLIAETSFDPAQISDLYSRTVVAGMIEAPLEFEFLAKPARMRPNTAAAMPEVADDFKTFTFRIKPGIYFADDPAFKGKDGRQVRRELIAEDYVYSLKRHYDPRWKSANLYILENAKILGLSELRKKLTDDKKPFDYDTPVEGLRVLDRYTFQIKLGQPTPRLLHNFTDGSFTGAVAREVVEFYGDKIGEHPVGTGPFVLKAWKRSSRIVLAKNPNYREVLFNETAPAGNARLEASAALLKGKRLPLIDEVHISIIEEPQPRWLSFLNEEQDVMDQLPADFAPTVIPNNMLAPNLAKKGIVMVRYPRADVAVSYFGMENPVVGGYEPHKVALRRAISLAVDVDREIRLARRGQAIPAQGVIGPETYGYNTKLKTEMGDFSRARAMALLDMHGYVDKDGDGWRELPGGGKLVLSRACGSSQQDRRANEVWRRSMDAVGLKMEFNISTWPELLKKSRAGTLMMWGYSWGATSPDGGFFLGIAYGPNASEANDPRFSLPAFDRLFERQRALPDGTERDAVMRQAKDMLVAYMPYKVHLHNVYLDVVQPWTEGFWRHPFMRDTWRFVDPGERPA